MAGEFKIAVCSSVFLGHLLKSEKEILRSSALLIFLDFFDVTLHLRQKMLAQEKAK